MKNCIGRLAPKLGHGSCHVRGLATRTTACGLHIDKELPGSFNKILIANRGEIACRVIRTARELGVKTVAVYSDADANAMHVKMADEAYRLGEAPAAQSYLLGDKILEVAKASGAQAIHPGYGFLSENADFATRCEAEGVEFIGPPASAIVSMGSKSASKEIMINANVPVVPGYHGTNQDPVFLREEAKRIGYPLMIKAVLGGGGKGMRIVMSEPEFDDMLEACKRESLKSFSDDRVLLERYIQRPRHIEFQVFADKHGNAVHFLERDCSVQRRHQKVLEEAPAPGMSEELRQQMGKSAVDAARAVGYVGAGTVEFIFDAETDEYFFMEMNTRLQVEHPVTEMIVERDLVQLQLHVAAGHVLQAKQDDIKPIGHALEARVYAENPYNNFLPATGQLDHLSAPNWMDGVRVETGVGQGDEVSIFYDPMIAKLVVHANDRKQCLDKMLVALEHFQIVGTPTNISFLQKAVHHPAFRTGKVETGFIAEHEATLLALPHTPSRPAAAATLAVLLQQEAGRAQEKGGRFPSPWVRGGGRPLLGGDAREVTLMATSPNPNHEAKVLNVKVEHAAEGEWDMTFDDGEVLRVSGRANGSAFTGMVGQRAYTATVVEVEGKVHTFFDGEEHHFALPEVTFGAGGGGEGSGGVAPMAGKVVKVAVKAGDTVAKGDPLVIMEAMKMEHVIKAPKAGVVEAVFFQEGDFVDGGKLVVAFEADADEAD